jgi:hypothetical protein
MSPTTITRTARRELARRQAGGLEITLFWDTLGNRTSIDVHHTATGETVSFRVPPARALDAFHHPFAYLARKTARPPRRAPNPSLN